MQCTKPIYLQAENMLAACGKCRACRRSRSREWSVRLWHETMYHSRSSFVTLTYDEDHVPEDGMLKKTDFQKFMKRLRKDVDPENKVMYYATGEYGDKYGRPHYHAIMFGLGCEDELLFEENWCKGIVSVGTVTPASTRYVSNYIQKKLYGKAAASDGRVQPFSLMSQGIGKKFALENERLLKEVKRLTVNGVEVAIPKAYLKWLGIDRKEYYKEVIEEHSDELERLRAKYGNEKFVERYFGDRRQRDGELESKERLEREKKAVRGL